MCRARSSYINIVKSLVCLIFIDGSMSMIWPAKHFMYPERRDINFTEALDLIRPEHVAFGSGASALLSHLALSLAEEGDAVLIPAPYYAAFDADLKVNYIFCQEG